MTAWLVRIVGTLGFLAVAVTAGFLGWARETSREVPASVLQLLPSQSDALFAYAENLRTDHPADWTRITAFGARLLHSSPLSEAPLVLVGLSRSAVRDQTGARSAFLAATRRQPRNVSALSWLAADALQRRDYYNASDLLERLQRLNPDGTAIYSAAWAGAVRDPAAAAIFEARLASGSVLAGATLRELNASLTDDDLLVRLNRHSSAEQSNLVRRLVSTRGPSAAFLAWLEFAPAAETVDFSWPFDPAFVGSAAPAPFNWTLSRGAELLKQGGLFVRYPGKGSEPLAEQLMLLAPGDYTFKAEMAGAADRPSANFAWVLQCRSGDPPLFEIVPEGLARTTREFTTRFSVPPKACGSQSLLLRGNSGEFPVRVSATVLRVSIQPEIAGR